MGVHGKCFLIFKMDKGSHFPVTCLAWGAGLNKCMLLLIKMSRQLCRAAVTHKVTLNHGSVGNNQSIASSPSGRGWGVCWAQG